jgi:hypothetical protein
LDSSIPVEIEIEEDALLNEGKKQKQIQIQLKKREANAFLLPAVLFLLLATTSYFVANQRI